MFLETTSLTALIDNPVTSNPQVSFLSIRYLSWENQVYGYDLRKATAPILRQPTHDLSPILQNQDEVNQIALAYSSFQQQLKSNTNKRKASRNIASSMMNVPHPSLYLAAADDAGTIRVTRIDSASSDILHHDPNGVAVVPSCAFRPGTKSLELASGGMDCKLQLWDVSKPRYAGSRRSKKTVTLLRYVFRCNSHKFKLDVLFLPLP